MHDYVSPVEELEAIEAELCRRRLRAFIEYAWPFVEPKAPFVPNWHIDVLCDLLESVTAGTTKRVIINVPPGSMKSLLVSVLWPAWEWANDPTLRYLTASYSAALSIRDNLRLRDIVTSDWYQKNFKIRLDDAQAAKQRFNTTEGGWRIATSVNGLGTGEHPDRIIIDDPISADQARSDAERKAANDWFDRTISTRVSRNPAILVIMQRLHQDDLSGHLLENGGYEHVCFLMRYQTHKEADQDWKPDPRDPRRKAGELFWPDHFPEQKVRELERDLGPFGAAGQLQQQPVPEGGGLFKREWFQTVDAVPAKAIRARGWDTAGTEGAGDWTVGTKIATLDGIFYIEDVVRGQLGPHAVDQLMKSTAQADGPTCMQREEKEGGSAGLTVVEVRTKTLVGHDYSGVPISGDKVTRAKPFRSQCEAGNVKIVAGPWNKIYLDELTVFPMGKHDDQVDASSCAFNALLLEIKQMVELTW